MKIITPSLLFLAIAIADLTASEHTLVQADPRPIKFQGETNSYAVIAWAQSEEKKGYQIWGSDKILSKTEFETAITAILLIKPASVYIVGNNWSAGSELLEGLKKILKDTDFNAYSNSTFAFTEVKFTEETEKRKQMINESVEQPLTRSGIEKFND